jgi:ABC-type nickel/cobalt efflux system permease component RcnA
MDLSWLFILLTGLGLGFAHALDPDHVVAVTTLVCNNKSLRKSVTSAIVWGLGHTVVLLIAGLLVLALKVVIPDSLICIFEIAAAVLLIILGAWVIRPLIAEKMHGHTHENHDDEHHHDDHTHGHSNSHTHEHPHPHEHGHSHLHKSAFTGAIQGLGGSAAIMLVTLTTVSSVELGLIFIVVFGVGVITSMVCIAGLVGSIIAYTAANLEKVHRIIVAATGSASIIIGILIIIYNLI